MVMNYLFVKLSIKSFKIQAEIVVTFCLLINYKTAVCVFLYIFMYICMNDCMYVHMHACMYVYTGCPGRNVPDFGRMFLKLKYTDITPNTYIQS